MRVILLPLLAAGLVGMSACSSEKAADPVATGTDEAMTTDQASTGAMASDASASTNPMVGGAAMDATKPIAANASAAPNLTTLVSAVKQAGLAETLSGPGPFTVFAPTNDAFAKVPKATLDGLMKPTAKDSLKKVLTYHVVPGKMTASDLAAKIKAGGGKATIKTVEGENLTLTMAGDMIKVAGMGGSSAMVSTADVMQSNGVVHVVDGVLTPSM
jgi:uncharacterized surface protein with fasciclin (FAS1) repeats